MGNWPGGGVAVKLSRIRAEEDAVMRTSVKAHWAELNQPIEGSVPFMHLDVRGLVRAGMGNLIDVTSGPFGPPTLAERAASVSLAAELGWRTRDGQPASREAVAAEWDVVKRRTDLAPQGARAFEPLTALRLTDEAIERAVLVRLERIEEPLRSRDPFTRFDDWPADAQLGLLSMAWVMGPAFNFPGFQRFAQDDDWEGAAGVCRISPDAGTVRRRNDLNEQCFRNAARAVAEGIDPEILLIGDPAQPREPQLTGFVHPLGRHAYFFKGDLYYRYDIPSGKGVDAGFPLRIVDFWPGLFEADVDAVTAWDETTVMFLRGAEYLFYDLTDDRALRPARPLGADWPGVFDSGINAVARLKTGLAFFFKGDEYVVWDTSEGGVIGGPRPIGEDWPGLFRSGITTALPWPSGEIYFLAGAEYSRYDPADDRVADGFPRLVADDWPGLP